MSIQKWFQSMYFQKYSDKLILLYSFLFSIYFIIQDNTHKIYYIPAKIEVGLNNSGILDIININS